MISGKMKFLGSVATASVAMTTLAHAVVTNVDVRGVDPAAVSSVMVNFFDGQSALATSESVYEDPARDSTLYPFAIETGEALPEGATGLATVRLKSGYEIDIVPVSVRNGVVVVNAAGMVDSPSDGLSPDNAVSLPGNFSLTLGAAINMPNTDFSAEGAVEVFQTSPGVFADRGVNLIDVSPTEFGGTATAKYGRTDHLAAIVNVVKTGGENSFSMNSPATGDASISRGFAFFEEDMMFGTGFSFGDVPVTTVGNVESDSFRIRAVVDLSFLDPTDDELDDYFIYPSIGIDYRDYDQRIQFTSTATTTFGDFFNNEIIDVDNSAIGPVFGLTAGKYFPVGENTGSLSLSTDVSWMHRDASISASQSITGPAGTIDPFRQDSFLEEDGTYFGFDLSGRVGCDYLDGKLDVGLTGGIRWDEYFQFQRTSDGNGRGFTPSAYRVPSTYAFVDVRYKF
ncbi:MAG: hypothetical protein AAGC77_09720 [Pseudomonadota bacterium]